MTPEQEKPGEAERCEVCDGRRFVWGAVTIGKCDACKGTGRQPAAPFPAAIGAVAASLPTDPADEAEVAAAIPELDVRPMQPAAPAEPRGPAIINLGDALKADMDRVTKRQAEEREAKNAPAEGERVHHDYDETGECTPWCRGCEHKQALEMYEVAREDRMELRTRVASLESALAASEARTAELEGEAVSRERRANQYKEESDVRGLLLSAAHAEIARLRGLLVRSEAALELAGNGPHHDESWATLRGHIRSALASDPTKEKGGNQ